MSLPTDHDARIERARLSLEGLSLGDAFGERYFGHPHTIDQLIADRALARAPWKWTDDTAMALSVVEVLERHGGIDEDALAHAFARRYRQEPVRGYGGGAHQILGALGQGVPWSVAARMVFDGQGSMGNGGAMRVAPVGAYFADDLDRTVEHAARSAVVTHAHPDGQAGAIAIAVAAAFAWQTAHGGAARDGTALLETALARTPAGPTHDGIASAIDFPRTNDVKDAAARLGNGSHVISSDTVPLALWCAARHLDDFEEAMWITVSALGDRDTTCAIVGGIVALSVGQAALPAEWLRSREPLSG